MKKFLLFAAAAALAFTAPADRVVTIQGQGRVKIGVAIQVAASDFANVLKRNLELSGLFTVDPQGSVRVTGAVGGAVEAKSDFTAVVQSVPAGDRSAVRQAARELADKMAAAFGPGAKGFAADPIVFLNRQGGGKVEVCTGYADGQDVRQLTRDGQPASGPRWADGETVYYVGYLQGNPRVYALDVKTGRRSVVYDLKGIASPAAVSPDGKRAAIVASFQGNPDLYILEGRRFTRLTNTPHATEGCPAWSPDGREIVYVSDEANRQQLYVVNVATRKTRRLTRGAAANEPDWGPDGRIAYVTKANGKCVAVIDPATGETRLVTDPGNWEHPSWARDGRHVVASSDRTLYLVDTERDGDRPARLFSAKGNWTDPTWKR